RLWQPGSVSPHGDRRAPRRLRLAGRGLLPGPLRLDDLDAVVDGCRGVDLVAKPVADERAPMLREHGLQIRRSGMAEAPAPVVVAKSAREHVGAESLLEVMEDQRAARVD